MDLQEFGDNDGPYDQQCDLTDDEWVQLYLSEGFDADDIEDLILNELVGMDWQTAAEIIAKPNAENVADLGNMIIRRVQTRMRDYMKSEAMEAEGCYDPY